MCQVQQVARFDRTVDSVKDYLSSTKDVAHVRSSILSNRNKNGTNVKKKKRCCCAKTKLHVMFIFTLSRFHYTCYNWILYLLKVFTAKWLIFPFQLEPTHRKRTQGNSGEWWRNLVMFDKCSLFFAPNGRLLQLHFINTSALFWWVFLWKEKWEHRLCDGGKETEHKTK